MKTSIDRTTYLNIDCFGSQRPKGEYIIFFIINNLNIPPYRKCKIIFLFYLTFIISYDMIII